MTSPVIKNEVKWLKLRINWFFRDAVVTYLILIFKELQKKGRNNTSQVNRFTPGSLILIGILTTILDYENRNCVYCRQGFHIQVLVLVVNR